ncbi:hypothetical protein BSP239C_00921 [Brevibacterium sp. 239c]|nr:hypothetical protein BSP239C_00921 [Brevibacterium sp. 239c]
MSSDGRFGQSPALSSLRSALGLKEKVTQIKRPETNINVQLLSFERATFGADVQAVTREKLNSTDARI